MLNKVKVIIEKLKAAFILHKTVVETSNVKSEGGNFFADIKRTYTVRSNKITGRILSIEAVASDTLWGENKGRELKHMNPWLLTEGVEFIKKIRLSNEMFTHREECMRIVREIFR